MYLNPTFFAGIKIIQLTSVEPSGQLESKLPRMWWTQTIPNRPERCTGFFFSFAKFIKNSTKNMILICTKVVHPNNPLMLKNYETSIPGKLTNNGHTLKVFFCHFPLHCVVSEKWPKFTFFAIYNFPFSVSVDRQHQGVTIHF